MVDENLRLEIIVPEDKLDKWGTIKTFFKHISDHAAVKNSSQFMRLYVTNNDYSSCVKVYGLSYYDEQEKIVENLEGESLTETIRNHIDTQDNVTQVVDMYQSLAEHSDNYSTIDYVGIDMNKDNAQLEEFSSDNYNRLVIIPHLNVLGKKDFAFHIHNENDGVHIDVYAHEFVPEKEGYGINEVDSNGILSYLESLAYFGNYIKEKIDPNISVVRHYETPF